MDFQMPSADDPRRIAVRDWIAANPRPSGRQLAEAGYVAPHWPAPFGHDADPIHQLIIDDELSRAGIRRPANPIGIGWAGPTILYAGTEEQKRRYLMRLLSGEDFWCQLFSEPGSGSDLANLGTRAVRDGDEYVVNGQKIWTSGCATREVRDPHRAHQPRRTQAQGRVVLRLPHGHSGHRDPAHQGDDRRVHVQRGVLHRRASYLSRTWSANPTRVGDWPRSPWATNECRCRLAVSCGGADLPRSRCWTPLRERGPVSDPVMRQRLAGVYIEHVLLDLIRMRTLSARLRGEQPGPEASIRKILADEHGQNVMEVARDILGAHAMLRQSHDNSARGEHNGLGGGGGVGLRSLDHPGWFDGYMFARSLTIGGGTGEVQRNIVAERVLGLPHDIDSLAGMTWAQTQQHRPRVGAAS